MIRRRRVQQLVAIPAVLAFTALAAGCSANAPGTEAGPATADERSSSVNTEVIIAPAELAFEDEVDQVAGELEMRDGEPAALTVVTDTATVGVHSAPDSLYTRLATLGPGDNVLATGLQVKVQGAWWMEVSWGDSSAWVLSAAFGAL